MPHYHRSVIYRIFCMDPDIKEFYIGSTTNLVRRRSQHKQCTRNTLNRLYAFIRSHGGWDNWRMVTLKDAPCTSRHELEQIELECILKYSPQLNTVLPFPRGTREQNKFRMLASEIGGWIKHAKKKELEAKTGCPPPYSAYQ